MTGDATGRNRSPLVQGSLNHWLIIKEKLGLKENQLLVRKQNISHKNSRVLCASVMQNADWGITENCKETISDLRGTTVDEKGEIVKNANEGRHFGDNVRYTIDAVFPEFISKPHLYE